MAPIAASQLIFLEPDTDHDAPPRLDASAVPALWCAFAAAAAVSEHHRCGSKLTGFCQCDHSAMCMFGVFLVVVSPLGYNVGNSEAGALMPRKREHPREGSRPKVE